MPRIHTELCPKCNERKRFIRPSSGKKAGYCKPCERLVNREAYQRRKEQRERDESAESAKSVAEFMIGTLLAVDPATGEKVPYDPNVHTGPVSGLLETASGEFKHDFSLETSSDGGESWSEVYPPEPPEPIVKRDGETFTIRIAVDPESMKRTKDAVDKAGEAFEDATKEVNRAISRMIWNGGRG